MGGDVRFRIVENYRNDYWDDFDKFVELYNNREVTTKEIRCLLGLNYNQYLHLRDKGLEDGVICPRRIFRNKKKSVRKFKYYTMDNRDGSFKVMKWRDGKYQYFGRYDSVDVARRVVDELIKCDWDKKQLGNIKEKLGII